MKMGICVEGYIINLMNELYNITTFGFDDNDGLDYLVKNEGSEELSEKYQIIRDKLNEIINSNIEFVKLWGFDDND